MKIIRNISSSDPTKCKMIAKGFFGNVKGEVIYVADGLEPGYAVIINNKLIGGGSNFYHVCNMLLDELKIVKTICV
jgi:hypothetical protein